ncbi:hypothetical protein DFR71_0165 [Nocardia alba]|uniref:Uncharacterized protein n=1 Tax=Nocardia alba TaxID=225051 RepID=A0A4R1FWA9_9NOCA|nr:hypothetical protein DFR71_0165 [Nocardia alba]
MRATLASLFDATVSRTPDPGPRTPDPGPRTPDPGPRTPDAFVQTPMAGEPDGRHGGDEGGNEQTRAIRGVQGSPSNGGVVGCAGGG